MDKTDILFIILIVFFIGLTAVSVNTVINTPQEKVQCE